MDTASRASAQSALDPAPARVGTLIYRQSGWTRLTHWVWAVSLFFLLLTGLQIFNAHPTLYLGKQSGFGFDNEVLAMRGENTPDGPVGYTRIFGKRFDTTGVFGVSGGPDRPVSRGFPAWATIPSWQDLATGRVVHFFFAWVLSGTLLVWLAASLVNGHIRRDLAPRIDDLRQLPRDIADHAKLKFHHRRRVQYAAEIRLWWRAVRSLAADDPHRPGNVADNERGDPFSGRYAGRTPDRAHHPFCRRCCCLSASSSCTC